MARGTEMPRLRSKTTANRFEIVVRESYLGSMDRDIPSYGPGKASTSFGSCDKSRGLPLRGYFMVKIKLAAAVTVAMTALSIGSAQAQPLPDIQLTAVHARVLSQPSPPPLVSPAAPRPTTTNRPLTWWPTQPNLAPAGSFPGRVSRRGFDPSAK